MHVLVLSSVLSEPIVSVFPDVPQSLYHGAIQPQSTSQHLNVSGFRPLIIFWSQYGNPNKVPDSHYTSNHVVPLVASEEGELVVTSTSGPSTEGVERLPQLLVTRPSCPSTEGVERSPQLVVISPSSPSSEGIERSPQLVVTSQSCPSTQDVERSPQFVVTTPSGPSTEGVERLPPS